MVSLKDINIEILDFTDKYIYKELENFMIEKLEFKDNKMKNKKIQYIAFALKSKNNCFKELLEH